MRGDSACLKDLISYQDNPGMLSWDNKLGLIPAKAHPFGSELHGHENARNA